MPIGNHLFKVVDTYEWNDLNDLSTEKAKQELITKINAVVSSPYKIISHEAGLRPSVVDRRPEIVPHPLYKHFYVFNGLGTKAVMIAPFFAKQFVDYLQNKALIDADVNSNRFL